MINEMTALGSGTQHNLMVHVKIATVTNTITPELRLAPQSSD